MGTVGHPIYPVMLSQLSPRYCRPSSDGRSVLLNETRRSRLSVVGIVERVAGLLHVDDGSCWRELALAAPVDADDAVALDAPGKRYARVIVEYDAAQAGTPWRVVALRSVRQFDEIPFHAMHALYCHLHATTPTRNEAQVKRPKMSAHELMASIVALIAQRREGVDRRVLYDEFAPANSAEAINEALMALKGQERILAASINGPFFLVP
jgi:hypothetical protein